MSEREDTSYELFETSEPRQETPGTDTAPADAPVRPHPPVHREVIRGDGSLGGYLRELRCRRSLTIDQVAAETRIKPFYLQALEEENFQALPQLVYIIGYVRKLGGLYGLDDDATAQLSAALREQLSYELPDDINKSVLSRESSAENDRKLHRMALLVVAVFVLLTLLIVAGAATLWLKLGSAGKTPADPAQRRRVLVELIERPHLETDTVEPR